MRKTISKIIIALCAFVFAASAAAQTSCDNLHGLVCIEAVQTDTSVTLYADNRYPLLTVTLSVDVKLNNLERAEGSAGPFVLKGGSRQALATYAAIETGPWSYNYAYNWNRGDITSQHDTTYRYRLPYETGASFRVSQGCNDTFTHHGAARFATDFDMKIGTPVHASRDGRVVDLRESYDVGGATEAFRAYGNYVIIEHSDGTLAQYFHLRKNGAAVALGERVARGALIGYSGNTGQSTGPHLHFDVVKGSAGRESETLPISFDTARGAQKCPAVGSVLRARKQ